MVGPFMGELEWRGVAWALFRGTGHLEGSRQGFAQR